jgi:hypothetical protein
MRVLIILNLMHRIKCIDRCNASVDQTTIEVINIKEKVWILKSAIVKNVTDRYDSVVIMFRFVIAR